MTCRTFSTTALLILTTALSVFTASAEMQVSVDRISDRILVVNVPAPQSTNVIAINSSAGIVVIDSDVSPTFAAAIRARITEEFASDIFYCLINTHGHGDHTSGNQIFNDVLIIGHDDVVPMMVSGEAQLRATAARLGGAVTALGARLEGMDEDSEQAAALRARIAYYDAMRSGLGEEFTLTPPTVSFNDAITLRLGDLTLELTWFGVAHSTSDILIYCPEEKVLMTGDLFAPGADLYIDSQRIGHIRRWIEQLETVTDRSPDPVAIVPGHGDLLAAADIDRALDYAIQKRDLFAGRESAFFAVKDLWEAHEIDAGLQRLRELQTHPESHYLIHSELDSYAFGLMMEDHLAEALQIFTVLAELFPDSDVAYDSLGEVYVRMDKTDLARLNFTRALEINPDNRNAASRLGSLDGS